MATEQKMFTIPDMTWNHCKASVTDALKKVPGVQSINIDLESHRATVGFDGSKTDAPKLAAAIRDAGFSPQ